MALYKFRIIIIIMISHN